MYRNPNNQEKNKFSNKEILAMVVAALELLMPYFIFLALGLFIVLILFEGIM